jgi:LPS O-antigen subunit length determinant protein (WzzB/FepE family)
METRDKERDLLDYIEIAWKKKWLIIIPAFICALAAGIVTSLATPKWEVDAIVLPGKFFVHTEQGGLRRDLRGRAEADRRAG